jgi:hypothetical protein
MASVSRVEKIQKLDGTNWEDWKFSIVGILKGHRLWNVVTGVEYKPVGDAEKLAKCEVKDEDAKHLIASSLVIDIKRSIYDCKTAEIMFKQLQDTYASSSVLNKQHTLRKFLKYTMKKDQSPCQAMSDIERIAEALADMGLKQEEEMIITKIMDCLPRKFFSLSVGVRKRSCKRSDQGFAKISPYEGRSSHDY